MSVEISQQEISFRNSSINYIQYIIQYIENRIWSGFPMYTIFLFTTSKKCPQGRSAEKRVNKTQGPLFLGASNTLNHRHHHHGHHQYTIIFIAIS